ncbi:MAG TPA: hypothetical protein VHW00_03150 [Thermoanaerobaculia bacterium]|nr:hypothetical protein [Thermoanaerobaculia bacterium]
MLRLLFAVMLCAIPAFAHPPVSVVIDAQGNAYYSDLAQVWKVAANGTKSVAVPNVHTHELALDARGNLYGEHLWYEGDATKKWGHYVWRRAPDGRVVAITHRREGFPKDFSFVRDAAGNMYLADESRRNVLKRTPAGVVSTLARGLTSIHWMTASPSGTLYVADGVDVVRIRGGRVERILRKATKTSLLRPHVSEQHALMGLWLDRAENVYVADFAQGEVKRITPAGKASVFVKSTLPWSPVGGAFAPNGDLYLLEVTMTNTVRLRKIIAPARRSGPA